MEQHTLGQRIRRERQNLHLTQEQLAEKLNVSSAYIGFVERGERNLTLNKLSLLADILGVSIDYLLSDDTGSSPSANEKQMLSLFASASREDQELILDLTPNCSSQIREKAIIRQQKSSYTIMIYELFSFSVCCRHTLLFRMPGQSKQEHMRTVNLQENATNETRSHLPSIRIATVTAFGILRNGRSLLSHLPKLLRSKNGSQT